MRKLHPSYHKENKYDQLTNFSIDLENEINRSIVLPKIAHRNNQHSIKEYLDRKQHHDNQAIYQLQGEVLKLRRQVLMLEDNKYKNSRLRTEDNLDTEPCICQRHMLSHHTEQNKKELRNSEDDGNDRVQRNTDKQSTRLRKVSPSPTYQALPSQVQLENPSMLKVAEQRSKDRMISNSKGTIEKQKMVPKKKKKKSNPLLKKKLRACILAVYFSILLPSLSRKVYSNKLKLFMNQYPHEIYKYYQKKTEDSVSKFKYDQAQLWTLLEQKIDIMEAIQAANLASCLKDANDVRQVKVRFQILLNQALNGSQQQIKNHLSYEEQIMSPKNVAFLLDNLVTILGTMLQKFTKLLKEDSFFEQNWKTLAQNIFNNFFVNNSRPKLLSRVIDSGLAKMHPSKELLVVPSKEAEIALLSFDFFCRIYCYRWLNKLHKDKITSKYSQKNTLVGNFLLTFLYLAGEFMVDETIKNQVKTNRSLPEKNNSHRKIRPILPLSIKKKYKGLNINVKRLIIDAPFLDQASQAILQSTEIVHKLKAMMLASGTQLYELIKKQMRTHTAQVKQDTINNQKYIILNDKSRPENMFTYEQTEPNNPQYRFQLFRSANYEKEPKQQKKERESKATVSIMIRKPKTKF